MVLYLEPVRMISKRRIFGLFHPLLRHVSCQYLGIAIEIFLELGKIPSKIRIFQFIRTGS